MGDITKRTMPRLEFKAWKNMEEWLPLEHTFSQNHINCYVDFEKINSKAAATYVFSSYELTNIIDINTVDKLDEGISFIYGKNVVPKILELSELYKNNYIYLDNNYLSNYHQDNINRFRLIVNHIHPQCLQLPIEENIISQHLKPWKKSKTEDYILICPPTGPMLQYFGLKEDWVYKTIRKIRLQTNREILIRFKNQEYFDLKKEEELDKLNKKFGNVYYDKMITEANLYELLMNCYAVVAPASGVGVIAAMEGIPVFSEKFGPVSMISETNYENINTPIYPDRKEWLNLLLQHEFTMTDIYSGEWLVKLKKIYPKELKRILDEKINLF